MINDSDMKHLRRCIELAKDALDAGDKPFGSVLVSGDGEVLAEDRNRDTTGDPTQHPEFSLARWAAQNMAADERKKATVYTSGEHCPMCSAAHGWAGLDRIVYASSSEQLGEWFHDMGISSETGVRQLPIQEVIEHTTVEGPVPEMAEQVRQLQRQCHLGER